MRLSFMFGLWFLCVQALVAQEISFSSSNLPIVILDTEGRNIPNEPKTSARMWIIDNGPDARNHVSDTPTGYEGFIGIELRGATSRTRYPKKQYALETRRADGSNRNVSLLGLPEENDWVLYAPYGDKSLMRNVLAYRLARSMGQYASRTRYCEVVLNGEYQGVYVLMEKIKRDGDRVDIDALEPDETKGNALTSGYIVKIDKRSGGEVGGWRSPVRDPDRADGRSRYQYHDPKPSELAAAQAEYIQDYITRFEQAMASDAYEDSATGYPAYIDVASFVDFLIINELSKNVDGYRLSSYLYKERDSVGGKLYAGPVWDFNLAFGNADYYAASDPAGFQITFTSSEDPFNVPFWWRRLFESPLFRDALADRWAELRQSVLHEDELMQTIDDTAALLGEAQARNFERWPILGKKVWPNEFVGQTYGEEVEFLKQWLRQRIDWLDASLPAARAPKAAPLKSSN